jgi:hypothetical protein
MINIDQSLRDPNLLGAALGDTSTWSTWTSVLKAAFALPLSKSERAVFKAIAGDNRKAPRKPCREIWAVCGRGSGKSRMSAAISVYVACFVDHKGKLAKGETGTS